LNIRGLIGRLLTFVFLCMDWISRPLSLIFGDGYVEIARRFAMKGMLVVGPIFIVTALGFVISTAMFLKHSVQAGGVVLSLATKQDTEDGTTLYAPVFSFTAADGSAHVISSDVYTHPAGFAAGDHVQVRYAARTPQTARIDTFWQIWFTPFLCGAMGMAITICGIFLVAYDRWLNRRGLAVTE
jgi:Protein of unknown function (DUF3592)